LSFLDSGQPPRSFRKPPELYVGIELQRRAVERAFFVPGQVDVAEGSCTMIFSVFGLPAAAAVTPSFARRVRTPITEVIGLMALIPLRSPKPVPQP
jgi:hypothetical protein